MADKSFISDLITSIAEAGRGLVGREREKQVTETLDLVATSEALLSGRGEASGVAMASDILAAYRDADDKRRRDYLAALAKGFGPDRAKLDAAISRYLDSRSDADATKLSIAAEPRRQEVLRRLNRAPGGTAALVRMREDLIRFAVRDKVLDPLDSDFTHLFSSWFNRGFLVLRRIDWTTPANILAKIIRYEAVHTIKSWEDLRARLEPPDRRCYAFFHPQLVDEPLVFVEVALTEDMPGAISPLLELERKPIRAEAANTAVFYSISNCQDGLRGVSFGNFLIKQVVEELRRDLPGLKTFVTLSPVPGFADWLEKERPRDNSILLDPAVRAALAVIDEPNWITTARPEAVIRDAMLSAAAAYFLLAKNGSGRPVDPVARFHLGNGARLERLNWKGDLSAKGMGQAHGLMVNYLYDLDAIEENHEAYANANQVVASSAVKKHLKTPARAKSLLPVEALKAPRVTGKT